MKVFAAIIMFITSAMCYGQCPLQGSTICASLEQDTIKVEVVDSSTVSLPITIQAFQLPGTNWKKTKKLRNLDEKIMVASGQQVSQDDQTSRRFRRLSTIREKYLDEGLVPRERFEGYAKIVFNSTVPGFSSSQIKPIHVGVNSSDDEMFYTFTVKYAGKKIETVGDTIDIVTTVEILDEAKNTIGNSIDTLLLQLYKIESEIYDLREYMDSPNLQFDYVRSVKQDGNRIKVTGTVDSYGLYTATRDIIIDDGNVYKVKNKYLLDKSGFSLRNFEYSLNSVPIKFRYGKRDTIPSQILSEDISIGLNVNMWYWKRDRYKSGGQSVTSRLGIGLTVNPTVVTLNEANTDKFLKKEEKLSHLFFSTGLSLSYSYNGINFIFVPLGVDLPVPYSIGRKWIYAGEPWVGIGIGVDPKLLSRIF